MGGNCKRYRNIAHTNNCLFIRFPTIRNKDATYEELDDISRMMRIIIREQDTFKVKVKENDLSSREVNALDID